MQKVVEFSTIFLDFDDLYSSMKLRDAFQYQIEHTRLLTETDLTADTDGPMIWNGVIFRLHDGNCYSSGKSMQIGDQFIIGYLVKNTKPPTPILLETSELDEYEKTLTTIRIADNVPILAYKDQSDDQYKKTT